MGLISTGDLRTWLGIAESDKKPNEKLESLTNAIEDFVEGFTNRKLMANTYYLHNDYSFIDGGGGRSIQLPVYPVSYVSDVRIDNEREFGSGSVLASADRFWYSDGELISEGCSFLKGRRNVRVDYIAGYAPIVGGTHDSAVSTYPLPYDLRQVMIEMCVETFKEGITAVHTVQNNSENAPARFVQMLTQNSAWRNTLNNYKDFSASLQGNY